MNLIDSNILESLAGDVRVLDVSRLKILKLKELKASPQQKTSENESVDPSRRRKVGKQRVDVGDIDAKELNQLLKAKEQIKDTVQTKLDQYKVQVDFLCRSACVRLRQCVFRLLQYCAFFIV